MKMTTVNDIIDSINQEIEDTIIMDDYDGGKVHGLRLARSIVLDAKEDGPRYFGTKNTCDTPLN